MNKESQIRSLANLLMVFFLDNLPATYISTSLANYLKINKFTTSKKSPDSSPSASIFLEQDEQNTFNSENKIAQNVAFNSVILLFKNLGFTRHYFTSLPPNKVFFVIPDFPFYIVNRSKRI